MRPCEHPRWQWFWARPSDDCASNRRWWRFATDNAAWFAARIEGRWSVSRGARAGMDLLTRPCVHSGGRVKASRLRTTLYKQSGAKRRGGDPISARPRKSTPIYDELYWDRRTLRCEHCGSLLRITMRFRDSGTPVRLVRLECPECGRPSGFRYDAEHAEVTVASRL